MRSTSIGRTLVLIIWIGLASPGLAHAQQSGSYPAEDDLIEVMFAPGSRTLLRNDVLVDEGIDATTGIDPILKAVAWHKWDRISAVGEEQLDLLRARGQARTGRTLYDLNNIYRLRVPKGTNVWQLSQELEALPGVHRARPVPRPVRPPSPPSYEAEQGYLASAIATPTGVGAQHAWTYPGGEGTGVTVCDLEYEWNYDHADVTKAQGAELNSDLGLAGFGSNHGTAVAGVLVADDNGWGVTGVCHGATLKTCGTYYGWPTPSWNVPGALLIAMANLQAGDVILIENQWDYTGEADYVPVEWWTDYYPAPQSYNAVYAAIETAVANGIIVVETGGNGEGDSGVITWYGDSGAIVVGAGGAYAGGTYPGGDLQKLELSTFGPRFDLQGWGEDVVTTGYGDLYNAEGTNLLFTNRFNGTSSAGAVVAGAVASCVGFWKANISPGPPPPSLIRDVLKATGTPQVTPPVGNIGPRPDLLAAFAALSTTTVGATAAPRARVLLEPATPNPMNPTTSIKFYVAVDGKLTLTVYDIRGRTVRRLLDEWRDAGDHVTTWDGRGSDGMRVASGMYFIRLEAAGETRVTRSTLVK
jgi:serine protease